MVLSFNPSFAFIIPEDEIQVMWSWFKDVYPNIADEVAIFHELKGKVECLT